MIALALLALTVALTVSAWTTAYAWNDAVPSLLWLDIARREDAWLDSIEAMHETLHNWEALEAVVA
jgi:hypothetical protein